MTKQKVFAVAVLVGIVSTIAVSHVRALDVRTASGGISRAWQYVLSLADIAAGGVIINSVDGGTFGSAPVNFSTDATVASWTDGCGTYKDMVSIFAANNITNTLTLANPSYGAMYWGLENPYCVYSPNLGAESYLRFRDTGGAVHQLMGFSAINNGTHDEIALAADTYYINARVGQYLKVQPGQVNVIGANNTSPLLISGESTGCPWIQQLNSSVNTYISLACSGAGNTAYFGDVNFATVINGKDALGAGAININKAGTGNGEVILRLTSGHTTGVTSIIQALVSADTGTNTILANSSTAAGASNYLDLEVSARDTSDAAYEVDNGTDGYSFGIRNTGTHDFVIAAGINDVRTNPLLILTNTGPVSLKAVLFASLPASANGTLAYCSNCTVANPCAGGGTGALAKRLNGAWVCN